MNHDTGTMVARLESVFLRTFGDSYPRGCRPEKADIRAWDSLGHVRLVLEIETEFGVQVSDHEWVGLHDSFDTVLRWIEERCASAGAEAGS
jgi:hypothetical protein